MVDIVNIGYAAPEPFHTKRATYEVWRCKHREGLVSQEPTTDRASNGRPAKAPSSGEASSEASPEASTERSIFRAEARQHYIQNQERVILPRLVSPRVFIVLWILAVLLTVGGYLIAFWPMISELW
jgi:hypothetical protein